VKKFNPLSSDAKQKIYKYCAYQERTHLEVRNKLYDYGLGTDEVDQLITQLIGEGYLNEERFAKTYVGGKFRIKGWGRIKITHELEAKGLTGNCIKLGLKEIDETDYVESLQTLLKKKAAAVQIDDDFIRRDKIARYAIQKGFEPELVWRWIKEIGL